MKKKILSLALCALMIIASFVGCAEKSRDELMNQIGEETSKGAVTLTMYILAEDKVSAEQELLVENAVNDFIVNVGMHETVVVIKAFFVKISYFIILIF